MWNYSDDAMDIDSDSNEEQHSEELATFLDGRDVTWEEPKVEQVITFMGNVRNYLMLGIGRDMPDRDMSAILETFEPANNLASSISTKLSVFQANLVSEPLRPNWLQPSASSPHGQGDSKIVPATKNLYAPLPGCAFIRILEILPGTASKVDSLLHGVSLDAARGTFEALSYTWDRGSNFLFGFKTQAEAVHEIMCNGIGIAVRPNLYDALLSIRKTHTSRFVWVDALCINQEDVAERGQQVKLMNSIFKHAFRVLIYLGLENSQADNADDANPVTSGEVYKAFSGICDIVNLWRERVEGGHNFPRACHSPHLTTSGSDSQQPKLSASSKVWGDILQLYECRWFDRLWVIQEAVVAENATVIWGHCSISWELIGLAAAIIRTNYGRLQLPKDKMMMHNADRTVPTGVLNAYFIFRISEFRLHSGALRYSFLQLLSLTRQFDSTDNRDKIYGILGLPMTDEASKHITPNYEKTTTEVCIDVARAIINTSDSLNILSSVQVEDPDKIMKLWNPKAADFDFEAPSWVPQWHFVFSRTLAPLAPHDALCASARTSSFIKSSQDPSELIVGGLIIGTVQKVTWPTFRSFWRGEQPDNSMLSFFTSRETEPEPGTRLVELLNRNSWTLPEFEKLALTLTGGKNWYGLPVHDIAAHVSDFAKCLTKFGLLWALKRPGTEEHDYFTDEYSPAPPASPAPDSITLEKLQELAQGGNADRFLDAAATTCERRARFVTDGGMDGIGPEAMKENDLLCVIYGADMPFIIRPKGARFCLVGECYVHDLMHGEAVRAFKDGRTNYHETWITLI